MNSDRRRPRRATRGLLGGFALSLAATGGAVPLDPDLSYGEQGRVSFGLAPIGATLGPAVVQEDGKLIVTGARTLQDYSGYDRRELFLRRYHADGRPDTAFGDDGETRFTVLGSDTINQITLQADGKAVLAIAAAEPCSVVTFGVCITDSGASARLTSALARFDVDGRLDSSLGGGGVVQAADFFGGYAVAVQPDGKLLLLGTTSVPRAHIFNWKMARFTADGARDPAFNGGATVVSRCDSYGYALALQPDGGIVVAGDDGVFFADPAANKGLCIERRLPDGSPDPAFNDGELRTYFGINVHLTAVSVLQGGKLLAVGRGMDSSGTPYRSGVIAARYGANGVLDPVYGDGGKWFVEIAETFAWTGFAFSRDGGFVAAGYEFPSPPAGSPQEYRRAFLKVGPQGDPDAGFGEGGISRLPSGSDIPSAYLRDLEDRWLLVNSTPLPDGSAGGALERYAGERPESVPAVEFYNTTLDHYFLTASAAEAAGIDAGAAGPGWQRTGFAIPAFQPVAAGTLDGVPQRARTLCRFYGTPVIGPNSHFYTISEAECAQVRRDPGWSFENYAFYAYPTVVNAPQPACAEGLSPVYRAYNNRFAQNDSNHRYTTDTALYQQMKDRGWIGEGIVFCAAAD